MRDRAQRIASSAPYYRPLVNIYQKNLLTDHASAKQPHPLAVVAELSVVKFLMPAVQFLTS